MPTLDQSDSSATESQAGCEPGPLLFEGQRLDQLSFHALYLQTPESFRAELIEGVVHVMHSTKAPHARADALWNWFLQSYSFATVGTEVAADLTLKLDALNEVQPDCSLLINAEHGGQTRYDGQGFNIVAPELVVEVSATTLAVDMGQKKDVYERSGVLEYVVFDVELPLIRWFVKEDGRFHPLKAGADGVFRSRAFPGLWLDERAFLEQDHRAVLDVLRRGTTGEEHGAFVARLAQYRANRP